MRGPRILFSRCFFEPVRYDTGDVKDAIVDKIKPFVEVVTFCPEVELGLGVPRPKIVLLKEGSEKRLFQPDTGRDLTEEMRHVIREFLLKVGELDGAVLKSKSPSCGVGSAKLYKGSVVIGKADGFLVDGLRELFPSLPMEDEGRLRNRSFYQHFLTRVFALAELRAFLKEPTPSKLVELHTVYKFILKACSERLYRELGRLVAKGDMPFEEKVKLYSELFKETLIHRPTRPKHVNILYHLAGYFTKRIKPKERDHLLSLIEKYKAGGVELRVPLEVIRGLALRFEEEYVLSQRYLNPFAEELWV